MKKSDWYNIKYNSYEYKQKCTNKNCNNEMILFTQNDTFPEYETTVGVRCNKCNCIIWFNLPVN